MCHEQSEAMILHRYVLGSFDFNTSLVRLQHLIVGVEGETYPCGREIFEKTYEEVE